MAIPLVYIMGLTETFKLSGKESTIRNMCMEQWNYGDRNRCN